MKYYCMFEKSCTKPRENCTKNFIIASSEHLDSLEAMSAKAEGCKFENERGKKGKKSGVVALERSEATFASNFCWSRCSRAVFGYDAMGAA